MCNYGRCANIRATVYANSAAWMEARVAAGGAPTWASASASSGGENPKVLRKLCGTQPDKKAFEMSLGTGVGKLFGDGGEAGNSTAASAVRGPLRRTARAGCRRLSELFPG